MTIPHKQAVIPFCDEVDDIAGRAGSVNTLVIGDGRVLGSSTDGLAVTSQIEADGMRALVLGTGGASKAVAAALEDAEAEVVVLGRRDPGWPPSADGFDILVNATPVKDELLVKPHTGMQIVDLAYLPDGEPTALIAAARSSTAIRAWTASTCSSHRGRRRSSAGRARPHRSSRCVPLRAGT